MVSSKKKNHLHPWQYGPANLKDLKGQKAKKTQKKGKTGHVLLDV